MRAFILALILAASHPDPVRIRLSATVLMHDTSSLRITCSVDPHPLNRTLEYGIVDFAPGSQRQLDGENARKTWESTPYTHIPCDASLAYCLVRRADGSSFLAKQNFLITGCDQ